jgi:hypothetical protein
VFCQLGCATAVAPAMIDARRWIVMSLTTISNLDCAYFTWIEPAAWLIEKLNGELTLVDEEY